MVFLMETWNMNNGTDGFAEFYATHPRCRFDEPILQEMVSINLNGIPEEYDENNMEQYDVSKALNDSWLQEQYQRWFKNDDRFLTMFQYCAGDGRGLFTNWLQKIGKAQKVIEDIAGN